MLDMQRLQTLHHFATHGTIAAAAEALGYSASAVSQQLSILEREVGAQLLERTARSAVLTAAGRELAQRAPDILDAVEAARAASLAASGQVAGRIVVSAIPTAASTLAPILAEFVRTHPDVTVALRQTEPDRALEQLRNRDLDLAVVDEWQDTQHRDVSRRLLARDRLVLALPPQHRQATTTEPVTLSGLSKAVTGQTWLCAPTDQPSRAIADALVQRSGAQPAAIWEFEGLATIAHLVAQGVGVSILPALALRGLDPVGIIARPLRPARHRKIVVKARRSSAQNPTVTACLDAIGEARF